jgi:hypothetical protein
MEIKLWDKDIKLIAQNKKMGGGSHTALEIALARKCLDLKKALHNVNAQQQAYFDTLYSISNHIQKSAGERIEERRRKEFPEKSAPQI